MESGTTHPSHPAHGSGTSQPESQGGKGPKSSVGQHYSTEKGTHTQSHPTNAPGKSQPGTQGEKVSKSSSGQTNPDGKGDHTTSLPDEDIRKTQLLSEGTKSHPKDSEGKPQPADRETTIIPNEGTRTTHLVTEGNSGAQDSGGNKTPADMAPKQTPGGIPSGTDPKGSVDKTQSTETQASGPAQTHQLPPLTLGEFQAALFSDDEDEELFEAGEEMDIEEPATEEIPQSSPPKAAETETEEHQEEESSTSSKDSILLKYDDILPLTERQLVKFLRRATNGLYDVLSEDLQEHHWEAAASYSFLKEAVEEYHEDLTSSKLPTHRIPGQFSQG